jgi:hypothetical protein
MKNRKAIEEQIRSNTTPETIKFAEARIKSLRTVIRKPTSMKIDTYIEKYQELAYLYDYGDSWQFVITLEQTLEDYKYGYPTLIDGAETAPPEDVGNIPGYEGFLEIYQDKNHPEHEDMKEWAEEQRYREFDRDFINRILKSIKYQKNEH